MALITGPQREQIIAERMSEIDLALKYTGAPALRPDQRVFIESAMSVAVRRASIEAARVIKNAIEDL